MTTVKNIYDYINSIAPFDAQEEWDNSGHLVGDFRREVKKCVMALDATKAVCEFSAEIGADLLLTHHPIIFGGLDDVLKGSPVYTLVSGGVAAISAHTNFDMAECGINYNLTRILELKNPARLGDSLVFVGELDGEMSIDDFAEYVSDKLDCQGLRYTDTDKPIKTVAVGGGACEEYAKEALQNADVFITGDMKYHPMLDLSEQGSAVISAGHYETEYAAFMMLKDKLEAVFTDVEFISANQPNPVKTV
ncbi:MAG: Nif3-like dinuclear metal center hexameric protein [Eubacterium sp.]|nr:Nif3-like dinuclear metal center hexameric protein [Eubacterium sp.]